MHRCGTAREFLCPSVNLGGPKDIQLISIRTFSFSVPRQTHTIIDPLQARINGTNNKMFGTTRPSSRAEARQLVQSIAQQHGHIRQEVLDRMSDADRREVEHAMQMKDGLIASSVVT